MIAAISSATLVGVDGQPVRVEAHATPGLPGYTAVGLPEATSRESRDRVRAAIESSGLTWPAMRLTVCVTRPGVDKTGTPLDLPIALAVLAASGDLPAEALAGRAAIGELGLDGTIRHVPGVLSLAAVMGTAEVIVPPAAVSEARYAQPRQLRTAADLATLVRALRGDEPWPDLPTATPPPAAPARSQGAPDLVDLRCLPQARTALEVAAAGGHHLLMVGPPGSGKTTLARCLHELLPRLDEDQARDVTRIHSAAGARLPDCALITEAPYQDPHHGASAVSLIGGGSSFLTPGALTLAHRGVLFLDNLAEYSPIVLDNLHRPLDEGVVRISRAKGKVTMPARALLVAAMYPCPCGKGAASDACQCSPAAKARYARRVALPLLDRLALRVDLTRDQADPFNHVTGNESTAAVRDRVQAARARARVRGVETNAELDRWQLDEVAPFAPSATLLAEQALRDGTLSARGLTSLQGIALTIADLADDEPPLTADHLEAALALRAGLSPITTTTSS